MQDGRDGPRILTFPDRSLISPDIFTCSNLPPEGWDEAHAKSQNVCGGTLNHREIEYNKDIPLFDTTKSESVEVDESERTKLLAETIYEKELTSETQNTDNINVLMDALHENADEEVLGFITSGHGRLLNPSDGQTHDILPDNMKLLLIASRGYVALGSNSGRRVEEKGSIKFLKEFRKWVKSKKPLFDGEGCLTTAGEEILAQLTIIMAYGKTYTEYYGVKYGNPIPGDKVPWYAIQRKDGWSSPFLMLKEYDREYNDQLFHFGNIKDVNRFGIIFMYTDKKDKTNKNIFLSLKPLLYAQDTRTTEELYSLFIGEEQFSLSIRMSDVFKHIQDLSTDERTKDLQFYFTHTSCRVVGDSSDTLTKQLSDKKESNTINCFIKKFPEDKREEITEYFKDAQDAGMTTIFEFYNMLKELNIYDLWLQALIKGGQGGDELFKIINFLGNLSVDVPATEIRGQLEKAMVGGARKKKKHTKKKRKSKKRKRKSKKRKKYKSKRKTKRR